jgi:thioredoxin reductase/Fe-S-cluster-containing hydrogenase component 2
MKRVELAVIGAGPAGLCAAIEAARFGLEVVVFDENGKPGGQLFKQIHKFFGSKEHRARERGFRIGRDLLKEAEELKVRVELNAVVTGIYDGKELIVSRGDRVEHLKANNIIIATGASENMIPFPGWTLPGVIGAGAAQTMANLHGIKPGERILMVGSGNVGVVVGLQMIQAGCSLEAVIDASPRIGGYGVHAAKIARTGVPFYLKHTIKEVYGDDCVEGAVIMEVDEKWNPVPGSEKDIKVDTVCMAVGLSPMYQLSKIAGCEVVDDPRKGGFVPVCDEYGATSVPGISAAGDVSGIEEASSAMIGGRIAGAATAWEQGYIARREFRDTAPGLRHSPDQPREGQFGHRRKGTVVTHTEEGLPLSASLLKNGFVAQGEISRFPGVPAQEIRSRGLTPVIECTQNIPCDPCRDACRKGCIKIGDTITDLPAVDEEVQCTGCGMCVAACPGQAIFLVDENYSDDRAMIVMPYEFHPLPEKGERGEVYDRAGNPLGKAEVLKTQRSSVQDGTAVVSVLVPREWAMTARFFKPASSFISTEKRRA